MKGGKKRGREKDERLRKGKAVTEAVERKRKRTQRKA